MEFNLDELKVGDRIYVANEKRGYQIKARNNRYLICTKPHFKTCLYFIADTLEMVRGTNNLVFNPYDYCIQEDIDDCLDDLEKGKIEVSWRNRVPFIIDKVKSS